MRTVRRIYFYLVALISLEVVVWGVIYLARTLFDQQPDLATSNLLAMGLSLILVGLPIFLLHWLIIQRNALSDEDERSTMIRAIFLYAVQLAVLIPVVQNLLAMFSRAMLLVLGAGPGLAFIGGSQSFLDNLVAILVNLAAWAYFRQVLRDDQEAGLEGSSLVDVRRLYRYIWMLYGLIFTIAGTQQLLRFVLNLPEGMHTASLAWIGNGIPMAVAGALIWSQSWLLIQRRSDDPGEQVSTLRLVVLYLITLLSAVIVVIAGVSILTAAVRLALGYGSSVTGFLTENGGLIALIIPMIVVWAYFEEQRKQRVALEPEPGQQAEVERLYRYILALLGQAVTFIGAWLLLETLVQLLLNPRMTSLLNDQLSAALACLAAGLPVWLLNWGPLQAVTFEVSTKGEQARRSLIRKVYLYVILFLTIIGVMVTGGRLFFLLLSQVLGQTSPEFGLEFARRLATLLLTGVWLAYHLATLRRDGSRMQRSLTDRHVRFPVLIMQSGEDGFAARVTDALQRQAPQMPVVVHRIDTASPDETMLAAKVVVLPARLAIDPPETLRLWLREYTGQRIFVPEPLERWRYQGVMPRTEHEMAQDTAEMLRQMAEGESARRPVTLNPWMIVAIVVAGLVIVPPLLVLFLSVAFRGF